MLSYRYQIILVLPLAALNIYLFSTSPVSFPENYIDFIIEFSQLVVCIFLLFKIEEIKQSKQIYFFLLTSVFMLLAGSDLDLVDEFIDVSMYIDVAEDMLKSTGFVIFILACIRWVDFHKKQTLKMQNLAEVDSLTGLSNRRAFLNMSRNYFRIDEGKEVSLLIIDVDYFKKVNDNYGHSFGDKVLIRIANQIKLSLRKNDYVARIGGEEFVVFLNNTNGSQALIIAEKIRCSVEELCLYSDNQKVMSSVSVGLSSTDGDASNFEVLFSQADKSLYRAKSLGRNQCCFYDVKHD